MPVILLATVGLLGPVFPSSVQRWVDLLPGAAVRDLVQVTWFGRTAGLGSTDGHRLRGHMGRGRMPAIGTLVGVGCVSPCSWPCGRCSWEPRT